LEDARKRFGGHLELRVLSTIPSAGFNCVDVVKSNGLVCVQHYEFHPDGEAAPILALDTRADPWYERLAAEAERLWDSAVEWPLRDEARIRRAPRLVLSEEFGDELGIALTSARSSLITGVARNNFLTTRFTRVEAQLRAGQGMRILLVDPESPAVATTTERYYAARSVDMAVERIRGSLQILREVHRLTQGDLSVRLTTHPLAMGLVAVNPGADDSTIYVEYYPYQARGGPKFVMRPEDGYGYDTILGEAEALWSDARPYLLT
jgi:hypothetical protein